MSTIRRPVHCVNFRQVTLQDFASFHADSGERVGVVRGHGPNCNRRRQQGTGWAPSALLMACLRGSIEANQG